MEMVAGESNSWASDRNATQIGLRNEGRGDHGKVGFM